MRIAKVRCIRCLHRNYEGTESLHYAVLSPFLFTMMKYISEYLSAFGYVPKIYLMCRKTPSFSYGDIRHVHRIYASN